MTRKTAGQKAIPFRLALPDLPPSRQIDRPSYRTTRVSLPDPRTVCGIGMRLAELVVSSSSKITGYTIGTERSSRSIEGENQNGMLYDRPKGILTNTVA